jgi:hypothetical protein
MYPEQIHSPITLSGNCGEPSSFTPSQAPSASQVSVPTG